MLKSWMKLTSDAALLGFEAQQVIGLRLLRIAAGGEAASFETERMVTEKITAFGKAAEISEIMAYDPRPATRPSLKRRSP
jgi:hypothetical protein